MWFSARLIFKSCHSETPTPGTSGELTPEALEKENYWESIIVLEAKDEDEALEKAQVLGQRGEETYENIYGETVHWKLLEVAEIHDISDDSIAHGTEVFARMFSRNKGDSRKFEYD